jgi:hypothetical protein
METPVEIRYAGVVVARANEVRRMTVGGVDMFLSMPEPLPAGTVVSLSDGAQARVEKVIESSDPSVAGIYIKMLNDGEAGLPWVPAFRESEVPAPRPPAVVVSPVIVRPVHRPTPAEVLPSRAEPIRVEQPPRPSAARAAAAGAGGGSPRAHPRGGGDGGRAGADGRDDRRAAPALRGPRCLSRESRSPTSTRPRSRPRRWSSARSSASAASARPS